MKTIYIGRILFDLGNLLNRGAGALRFVHNMVENVVYSPALTVFGRGLYRVEAYIQDESQDDD
jgi:hypothetical protein